MCLSMQDMCATRQNIFHFSRVEGEVVFNMVEKCKNRKGMHYITFAEEKTFEVKYLLLSLSGPYCFRFTFSEGRRKRKEVWGRRYHST